MDNKRAFCKLSDYESLNKKKRVKEDKPTEPETIEYETLEFDVSNPNRSIKLLENRVRILEAQETERNAAIAIYKHAVSVWDLVIPPGFEPRNQQFQLNEPFNTDEKGYGADLLHLEKSVLKVLPGLIQGDYIKFKFNSVGYSGLGVAFKKPSSSLDTSSNQLNQKLIFPTKFVFSEAAFSRHCQNQCPNCLLVVKATTVPVAFDKTLKFPIIYEESEMDKETSYIFLQKLFQLECQVTFASRVFNASNKQIYAALYLPSVKQVKARSALDAVFDRHELQACFPKLSELKTINQFVLLF
jgi:hypothetical protein